ncbi:MAG: hypothetical protein LUC93_03605 [Planctomycetaceae bacterium]|nr:hypothetical protein [Planctomycetaceae bacterium]
MANMQKIEARLADLQPGTLRHQVLVALKQFRASWVELGRLLNEMVYGGDYKDAGYDDFEVYCARELGLKKPTVQKLLVSYNYMKKYEHERLEALEEGGDDAVASVPAFQTVALLDRVRRLDEVEPEEMETVHRRVFEEADGDNEPAIRKELRAMIRPDAKPAIDVQGRELSKIITVARQLRRLLAGTRTVPDGLRERLEQQLTELEGLQE